MRCLIIGIEILYPKTDSVIDQTEDQSTSYLILGKRRGLIRCTLQ